MYATLVLILGLTILLAVALIRDVPDVA